MKMIVHLTCAMLLLLTAGVIRAAEAPPAGKAAQPKVEKKQTLCPVMGAQISTNLFVDVDGKRIYFCCGGCPAEFKKDPAKYIAKMENDGITLEKAPAAVTTQKPVTHAAVTPAIDGDHAARGCGEGCCK